MKRSIICPHKFFTGGLSPTRGKLRNWLKTAKKIKSFAQKDLNKNKFCGKNWEVQKVEIPKDFIFLFNKKTKKWKKLKKRWLCQTFGRKNRKVKFAKYRQKFWSTNRDRKNTEKDRKTDKVRDQNVWFKFTDLHDDSVESGGRHPLRAGHLALTQQRHLPGRTRRSFFPTMPSATPGEGIWLTKLNTT